MKKIVRIYGWWPQPKFGGRPRPKGFSELLWEKIGNNRENEIQWILHGVIDGVKK